MRLYTYNDRCNLSGTRIKEARLRLNLSQNDLAARLQVNGLQINQKAISRIELGLRVVPDFEVAFFAEALNVTTDWLLAK